MASSLLVPALVRRALLALSVAACGGDDVVVYGDDALHVTVTRSDATCRATMEQPSFDAVLSYDSGGIHAAVGDDVAIDLLGIDATAPAGTAQRGGELLTLERRDGWAAVHDGTPYRLTVEEERLALRDRLALSPLGEALDQLLPLHDFVRAHMAETRAVFRVAALASGQALDSLSSWPSYRAAEAMPLGMHEGDEPGLGMTCDDGVRCPLAAPFCVSSSEQDHRGVCTRACIDADDCVRAQFDGRCDLDVDDVRGVSTPLRMCSFACHSDDDCPGLSSCSTAGRCVARH